ncbi:MAG: PEP-CTERM sorting domain-containing protein [Burkholderiales bacterium PBB1]|jgi:hypothetical protein|nr:MAG: PEP-CTERM sorting domain-containing protein [Burkholderiales bacterium PBB1]
MKLIPIIAAAVSLCAAAPAFSAVTLDFEGTTSFSSIDNFYNGGTDGAGVSGVNYGVAFSGSALALDGSDSTLATPFTAPSGTHVFFAPDAPAVLNVASGFTTGLVFAYSSIVGTTEVKVFDGLNATGATLATFMLGANSSAFELFSSVSKGFAGTAYSVSFGDNLGNIAYDNVTIGAVPEPGSVLLMALGLALVGVVARRQRQD